MANHWGPAGSSRGAFYDYVDARLAELTLDNHPWQVQGLVWVQGEGDARTFTNATAYGSRLQSFVDEMRDHFNNPDMLIVFNQAHIDLNREYTAELRASQALFAAADPGALMVNIDDLPLLSDSVHFTSFTQQQLGFRMAHAVSIPEPSQVAILFLALAAGLLLARRRGGAPAITSPLLGR